VNIGRKIYFNIFTGDKIIDTGEREYSQPTTVEQDITIYKELSERNRETFDFIQLDYGEHYQDFIDCIGYKVNTTTKELEFIYPDLSNPEAPQQPRRPLSEEVNELKQAIAELSMFIAGIP